MLIGTCRRRRTGGQSDAFPSEIGQHSISFARCQGQALAGGWVYGLWLCARKDNQTAGESVLAVSKHRFSHSFLNKETGAVIVRLENKQDEQ